VTDVRRRDPVYVRFFEGWTGAGVLVAAYVAAEVLSYVVGRFPGLVVFLAWNVVMGPLLAILVIAMTFRTVPMASSLWQRLSILSSIAVPVGIILLTLTRGHGVARFFGLG
jgi:hypothetical protein